MMDNEAVLNPPGRGPAQSITHNTAVLLVEAPESEGDPIEAFARSVSALLRQHGLKGAVLVITEEDYAKY